MAPKPTGFLPSEAVKAILRFMTRKQLIALSTVNRQFLQVIDSPHFEKNSLLTYQSLIIQSRYPDLGYAWGWTISIDYHRIESRIGVTAVTVRIEQLVSLKWIRFNAITIYLPRNHEVRRAWLEVIDENSHCLRGANKLRIYYDGELEVDVVEIINKFSSLVRLETTLYP